MKVLVSIALALALGVLAPNAAAQPYPSKPVHWIVPYPAGGTVDFVARTLGQELSKSLGQPLLVENKPGLSGVLGHEFVAKSPADGYTLIGCNVGPMAVHPSLYPKLPYDPQKDLVTISILGFINSVIEVTPTLPVNTMKELVDYAKRQPGKLNFASSGPGSTTHLTGELLKSRAGISMQHILYKGSAPAVTDTIAGVVQIMIDNVPGSLPQIRAGRLRALAVTSKLRSRALPDVPTMEEAGFPGFEMVSWQCLAAPAATPKAVIDRINADVTAVLRTPAIQQKLSDVGMDIVADTPERAAQYIRDEAAKWSKIVKDAGVKLQF